MYFSDVEYSAILSNIKDRQYEREKESGADLEKYGGEVHCAKHCDEPLKAKIVSAEASAIFESHLHCTISAFTPILFLNPPSRLWRRPGGC